MNPKLHDDQILILHMLFFSVFLSLLIFSFVNLEQVIKQPKKFQSKKQGCLFFYTFSESKQVGSSSENNSNNDNSNSIKKVISE